MNDEQIVMYVRRMIINNLKDNDCLKDVFAIQFDKSNILLLEHIKGVIELFEKAKEILEGKD